VNAFDLPTSSRRTPSSRPTQEIALRYPASWFTLVNPAAATIERRTAAWLEEMGVIADEDARLRFRALSVGGYGGWPFPFVDAERLETITRFLTLWIYYDDTRSASEEAQEAKLAAVLSGEPGAQIGADPCLRAFYETARRYRGAMSERWLTRHAVRYIEWIRAVRREAPVTVHHQMARSLPTVEQYLSWRQMMIGVLPTLSFIEYVTDQELPDEVRRHPTFQAIERLAAEIVAIPNDLFGYSQDRRTSWVNAVSCMAAEKRVSIVDAMAMCAELHNRRVTEMVRLEASLLAQVKDRSMVEEWLRKVHQLIHGFTRWHDGAPNYRRVHQLEGGVRVQLAVRYT
jgi:hypothetical protein